MLHTDHTKCICDMVMLASVSCSRSNVIIIITPAPVRLTPTPRQARVSIVIKIVVAQMEGRKESCHPLRRCAVVAVVADV